MESSFKCDPQQQPAMLLLSSCAQRELELAEGVSVSVSQPASQSVGPVQPASWCHWRSPDSDREGDPSVGGLGVGRIAEHLKGTLCFPVEASEGD